jgi:hypothetical protein
LVVTTDSDTQVLEEVNDVPSLHVGVLRTAARHAVRQRGRLVEGVIGYSIVQIDSHDAIVLVACVITLGDESAGHLGSSLTEDRRPLADEGTAVDRAAFDKTAKSPAVGAPPGSRHGTRPAKVLLL